MFQIHANARLSPDVSLLVVEAPRVARHRLPGQFCIVRPNSRSERIPLTIADVDAQRGTVTLIVQAVGATTRALCALPAGQCISDLVGPLGKPTEIDRWGHVVLVGGGVGTAVIFPQAAALRNAGNRVTAVIGGRSRPYVILEERLRGCCDAVFPCTDDGTYGYHGFVTGKLAELLADASAPVNAVFAAGPPQMMRAVAELTRPHGVRTIVSLNPIMVDGTGMCGGCRVTVGGEMRFACVDGPEFDGHAVDFAELIDRLTTYRDHERRALEQAAHECRLDVAARACEDSHER
ncbi:MAG TPA: sulfide/dihydroorotate dehydrogenase-like FAD/NAD-binding protein [Phycisphaerae bacterium]|nr:sulfide/dihydroorotate dehydrogenase-like FAD/NAD-binding protein [Phycisphaerae bacterium]